MSSLWFGRISRAGITLAAPVEPNLRHLVAQVKALRLESVLFHDSTGCRESLRALDQLLAETDGALTNDGINQLKLHVYEGLMRHVRVHLTELLRDSEESLDSFFVTHVSGREFESLGSVIAAVERLNQSYDTGRSHEWNRHFAYNRRVGEQLKLLVGRWLAGGMRAGMPAGSAILVGAYGSGRSFTASRFSEALSSVGIDSCPKAFEIDLASPESDAEALEKIYTALRAACDNPAQLVIAFDNVNKASPDVIAAMTQAIRSGNFVTEAGTLSLSGRFLFFMCTSDSVRVQPEESGRDLDLGNLGNEFINSTHEVVALHPLSLEDLERIVSTEIQVCLADFRSTTGHQVTVDRTMIRTLAGRALAKRSYGHAVPLVIQDSFRLPLSELIACGELPDLSVRVETSDGLDVAVQLGKQIPLPVPRHQRLKASKNIDLEGELAGLVGLEAVKELLRVLMLQLQADRKRRDAGIEIRTVQTLHMLFLGNPGTGKTMVAELVGRLLSSLGVLREGQVIVVGRSDLVASYVGQTAPKTEAVVRRALGGVLFIDEAYSLSRENDSFGQEAIDTLVKEIETHRNDLVVILAGYTKEMRDFLKCNSGLESRFPHQFEFADYAPSELALIAGMEAERRGFCLGTGVSSLLPALFDRLVVEGRNDQGNGRLARNVVEAAIRRQSALVAADVNADRERMITLNTTDFDLDFQSGT